MAKKPETLFKERVLRLLKQVKGVWVLKTQEVSRRGVPDLLICFRGLFYAFELKSDEYKADKLQEYELNCILKAGGYARVIRPRDYIAVFTKLGFIQGEPHD